jgi:hypothetical protein
MPSRREQAVFSDQEFDELSGESVSPDEESDYPGDQSDYPGEDSDYTMEEADSRGEESDYVGDDLAYPGDEGSENEARERFEGIFHLIPTPVPLLANIKP